MLKRIAIITVILLALIAIDIGIALHHKQQNNEWFKRGLYVGQMTLIIYYKKYPLGYIDWEKYRPISDSIIDAQWPDFPALSEEEPCGSDSLR